VIKVSIGSFLLVCSAAFGANFTFYTSQSAFETAIAGFQQQTIGFDSVAPGSYPTLTIQGVTFTGDFQQFPGAPLVVQAADVPYMTMYFDSTGHGLSSLDTITAMLPSGVFAVGLNVGASGVVAAQLPSEAGLGILGGPGTNVDLTPASPFPFLGVVSDAPLASVTVGSSSFLAIGNFTFAGTSVPEPESGALMAIPLLAFALRQRVSIQ
jgi:hypothetical protein